MKNKETKKEKQNDYFKEMLGEFSISILFEVVWRIVLFIPKMMIRIIKNIW